MADAAYQTLVEGEAALEDAYACRDAAEASLDKLSSLLREAEGVGAEEAMRKLADMTGPVAEARSACRELVTSCARHELSSPRARTACCSAHELSTLRVC